MELVSPSGEPYVTSRDVADRLALSHRETVYRYIAQYGLPTHKVGGRRLFLMSEIDAWLMSRCTSPTPDHGREAAS